MLVVVDPPSFDDLPRLIEAGEQVFVETLVAEPSVKLSTKPFCIGFPGVMLCHSMSRCCCQARMAFVVISVPLSLTIIRGQPRRSTSRSSSRTTRGPVSEMSAKRACDGQFVTHVAALPRQSL